MDRTTGILIVLTALLLMLSPLIFPNVNPEKEIWASMISPQGIDSANPIVLDFNGSIGAFWIGSFEENGTERHYIFQSSLYGNSWSVGNIISSENIYPISLSGIAHGTEGIIAFTERGGPGKIYFIESKDSGKTWSSPDFLVEGEYPEFWIDDGIHMISYNGFNHTHTITSFYSERPHKLELKGDFLPPKVIVRVFSNNTLVFFIKGGALMCSSLEKGYSLSPQRTILEWDNISSAKPVINDDVLHIFFSTFEGDRLSIWEVHSSDAENWSRPKFIGNAEKGSDFSVSYDDDIYIAWNSGNFTAVRYYESGRETKIFPEGSEYFMCDNVLVFSSGNVGEKSIYAYVIP